LFRYFGTKGDIVMEWARGTTTILVESLRERPPDEPPLASLHAAFIAMCESFADNPAEIHAVATMIERTASLRPYSLLKHARWEDGLAAGLGERSPELDESTRALLARVAVAAFRVALDEWIPTGGRTPLLDPLDRAFHTLRHGLA
jgi:hypothetical protein